MRYWDTSALVPLLIEEGSTRAVALEHATDPDIITWWLTTLECASALARHDRTEDHINGAWERLDLLAAAWQEIRPTERVRRSAIRLLRVHPLRTADALQLAAAIVGSEDRPDTLPFVTLDDRLADAAVREGFRVIRPEPIG